MKTPRHPYLFTNHQQQKPTGIQVNMVVKQTYSTTIWTILTRPTNSIRIISLASQFIMMTKSVSGQMSGKSMMMMINFLKNSKKVSKIWKWVSLLIISCILKITSSMIGKYSKRVGKQYILKMLRKKTLCEYVLSIKDKFRMGSYLFW